MAVLIVYYHYVGLEFIGINYSTEFLIQWGREEGRQHCYTLSSKLYIALRLCMLLNISANHFVVSDVLMLHSKKNGRWLFDQSLVY